MSRMKGRFTLPGEAGYEALTLKLADKWGADIIRDSDGTALSDDILNAGYGIYSTLCVIRDHNEWAGRNMDKLQQSFLMAGPVVLPEGRGAIRLMAQFFDQQFAVNDSPDAMAYWQVYDRTTCEPLPSDKWRYDAERGEVVVEGGEPFHSYTVSFLAWQIWEQISMYNHVTNHWDKEHLMPIDPRHPEAQAYLLDWLDKWCVNHPSTSVIRFTSLFYNFTWMWGSSEKNRNLFTDWASYDFTVSPLALDAFEKAYGYRLTAEDFVNKGNFQVTHMPATCHKRDWMDFTNRFVTDLARRMVEVAHRHGKKAYVFYDDTWVGMEPYGERFQEIGFDGLIKCVFSGYEARLCSGVPVDTHEIRLHPYLFPVGLGGLPTFMAGGDPTRDARQYWINVRRGLLRAPIDRIGLGGYLHLTEDFPDFQNYIERISDEFRELETFHAEGAPYAMNIHVAVLHYWGYIRSWSLSGHFHETYMHDLIHINEALSGLPVQVDFINFDDVKAGALKDYDVVINAGRVGDAWSGGDAWRDDKVVAELYRWVFEGGVFIGVNEPSAVPGYDSFFRMAPVLGVDMDTGAKVCHGKWAFDVADCDIIPEGAKLPERAGRFLTDGKARVLMAHGDSPDMTVNEFGRGRGVYLGGFAFTPENTRLLLNLMLLCLGRDPGAEKYLTDNPYTECAWFPASKRLIVVNNSDRAQTARIHTDAGDVTADVPAGGQAILTV